MYTGHCSVIFVMFCFSVLHFIMYSGKQSLHKWVYTLLDLTKVRKELIYTAFCWCYDFFLYNKMIMLFLNCSMSEDWTAYTFPHFCEQCGRDALLRNRNVIKTVVCGLRVLSSISVLVFLSQKTEHATFVHAVFTLRCLELEQIIIQLISKCHWIWSISFLCTVLCVAKTIPILWRLLRNCYYDLICEPLVEDECVSCFFVIWGIYNIECWTSRAYQMNIFTPTPTPIPPCSSLPPMFSYWWDFTIIWIYIYLVWARTCNSVAKYCWL